MRGACACPRETSRRCFNWQPIAQPPAYMKLTAYLMLGVGLFLMSWSAVLMVLAAAPGPVSSFYRLLIGMLLMAGPFGLRVRAQGWPTRRQLAVAALAGVFFAGDMALWSTGVMLAGVASPTLLANTAPIWVGLGAVVFFREQPPALFWAGLVLAFAGTLSILGPDVLFNARLNWGAVLGLGAGLFYAGYQLITQKGRQKQDTLSFFWLSVSASTIVLLFVNLGFGLPLAGYPPATYYYFLLMGVVVQVGGYLLINAAQGRLPATLVATTLLVQPVLSALQAAWLLDERFSAWQVAGGALIVSGVLLVHLSARNGVVVAA